MTAIATDARDDSDGNRRCEQAREECKGEVKLRARGIGLRRQGNGENDR